MQLGVADEESLLQGTGDMSVHEAAEISVAGTSTHPQEQAQRRPDQQLFAARQRSVAVQPHNDDERCVDEATVDGNPRPSRDARSRRRRAALRGRQGGRDEERLDAGGCSTRPHLQHCFRSRLHRRNRHLPPFVFHSEIITNRHRHAAWRSSPARVGVVMQ